MFVCNLSTHLLTTITIVVIIAARNTNAPKEPNTIMELKLSLAPYDEVEAVVSESSLSIESGIFTSGAEFCLKLEIKLN